jgi:3,4-dihydroxy 2-butanone 4-phosphate synthase/GTP cyclohydrolase II
MSSSRCCQLSVLEIFMRQWIKLLLPVAKAHFSQTVPPLLKGYGIGAQILGAFGISDIQLLSTMARSIVGLEGFGLRIVEHKPIG